MKITFLGTSHGLPGVDRFCSSTMLEIGEDVYIIDGGAPVADLLIRRGISFSRIRAIFTTHMHGDHTLGLLPLLDLCAWHYKDASFDIFLAEQMGIDAFRAAVFAADKVYDDERLRMHKTEVGVFYSDDNITVTALPTRHNKNGELPSFSLIVDNTREGKRIVFTGDLHWGDAADFPIPAKEEPSDVIVCEMAHFHATTIFPILEKCPTKQIFINHMWFKYDECMAAVREAERTLSLGIPIHAVEDGEEYEL
ncbi:MAG: MBL fold metallo-hydrolase [Clostridia bacterium]|nr:MBL fold metallo-hydrolase [Clostridia bacterium]